MSIPWWVYLMGAVIVGFGVALHMLPSFLAKLEEKDRQRREAAKKRADSGEGQKDTITSNSHAKGRRQ